MCLGAMEIVRECVGLRLRLRKECVMCLRVLRKKCAIQPVGKRCKNDKKGMLFTIMSQELMRHWRLMVMTQANSVKK